ncbi:hypothetical protein K440DRAFT_108955 [Wilcoxina mikolae CBS 423.85]|nr:hypothetical protein K440DRAFT_108955 [Wilcoxina mikolae CBS 423.85]
MSLQKFSNSIPPFPLVTDNYVTHTMSCSWSLACLAESQSLPPPLSSPPTKYIGAFLTERSKKGKEEWARSDSSGPYREASGTRLLWAPSTSASPHILRRVRALPA